MTEAINDTLKAIAASLLMEQVLAPRFDFTPKTPTERATQEGFDYGEGRLRPRRRNVGFKRGDGQVSTGDQGPGGAQELQEATPHLPGGPQRGDHRFRAGQGAPWSSAACSTRRPCRRS